MATVTCDLCKKKTEAHYNGVKQCQRCNRWFCFDHAGPGCTQCPVCKTQTLK